MAKLLLLDDLDAEFIEQAIEAWTAVYKGDAVGYAKFQASRADVLRKLKGKYTKTEREEIAQAALDLMD